MTFISNISGSHSKELKKLIKDADEIYMAIAFLKQSGLNLLLPSIRQAVNSDSSVSIIAGRHYALTEPDALMALYKLFRSKDIASLRLANYSSKDPVFHPKLYLFKKGNTVTIVSGSANMTKGGLDDNVECSVMLKCDTSDKVWKDAYAFFTELMSDKRSEEGNNKSIAKYAEFYHLQKKRNRAVKAVPGELEYDRKESYGHLRYYYNLYKKEKGAVYVNKLLTRKNSSYTESKTIINQIANADHLTKSIFRPMLDRLISGQASGRWYSYGLQRGKKNIYTDHKQFQKLIKYVKHNHHRPVDEVFQEGMKLLKTIKGAGVNYLGEILMTYDRNRFANLNNTLVKALNEICGIEVNKYPQSYSATEYRTYCAVWQEIRKEFKLDNMLEVDNLLYQSYIKFENK